MKQTGILVLLLILLAACNNARASFQPRVFLPEAEIHADDTYGPDTAVPVKKLLVKPAQLQQVQVKQLQAQPEPINKAIENTAVTAATKPKKDTALIRRLYEGFRPKIMTSPDKIKVKQIIDSLVTVKDNPANTGSAPGLSYQDIVRILDSLLKANNIDTKKVVTDTALLNKPDTVNKPLQEPVADKTARQSFLKKNWWMIVAGLLALAAILFMMMKRKRRAATDNRVFFSYAWNQDEAFVSQLYNSLKNEGFNVVKDKENMGYKGVISKFMNEIGGAGYVVVAISDKYLRSKYCMYELYELYKNSGMNADTFSKKLFPIRIDETLNLGDPDTVNTYVLYWQQQEDSWARRMKEEAESITEEQARQYQFIKRLVIEVRNIVTCLADINALNQHTLRANDFADIKAALRRSMEGSVK